MPAKPHAERVLAIGSTANGRELWSFAADGTLARTPGAGGARPVMRRLDLGTEAPRAVVFSSDGTRLTCGGAFGKLRFFDTATGDLSQRSRGHRTELQELAARPGWALGDIDDSPLSSGVLVASAASRDVLAVLDTGGAPSVRLAFVDAGLVCGAVGRELRAWNVTSTRA
jgi:WD40 repeat protein